MAKASGYRAVASKAHKVGGERANAALRALTGLNLFECSLDLAINGLWNLIISGERSEAEVVAALDA